MMEVILLGRGVSRLLHQLPAQNGATKNQSEQSLEKMNVSVQYSPLAVVAR